MACLKDMTEDDYNKMMDEAISVQPLQNHKGGSEMLPESFGGRIIYLLQQYGPSFLKGAGVSMWLALVGTLFWMYHWFFGWYRSDDPGGQK